MVYPRWHREERADLKHEVRSLSFRVRALSIILCCPWECIHGKNFCLYNPVMAFSTCRMSKSEDARAYPPRPRSRRVGSHGGMQSIRMTASKPIRMDYCTADGTLGEPHQFSGRQWWTGGVLPLSVLHASRDGQTCHPENSGVHNPGSSPTTHTNPPFWSVMLWLCERIWPKHRAVLQPLKGVVAGRGQQGPASIGESWTFLLALSLAFPFRQRPGSWQ